jgi:hypothetical protein
MKDLSLEQMKHLRKKLEEYIENFQNKKDINATRERALTLFSTIFGDNSSEYKRFRDIGFSSWASKDYTNDDIVSFVNQIQGILDSFDVIGN